MLNNHKSILIYGLDKEAQQALIAPNYSTIVISKEMANMKLKEIIDGYKFESNDKELPEEKVVIFNNFTDEELQGMIKLIRAIAPGCILAVVTPTSIDWTFAYLVEHLMEEREWYRSQQKGRA